MLTRSGPLPRRSDYAFEVKWDGFRAIVATENGLRVRSRRGWDMTAHVNFLADLPACGVFDGELVALDEDGKPDFIQLCECVLLRRGSTPLTLMVFDVLRVDGKDTDQLSYTERRAILEELNLNGRYWRTPEAFDDGESLWDAICEHDLVCRRKATI
jgi:bifunctional non-homologous end joining protein LigD